MTTGETLLRLCSVEPACLPVSFIPVMSHCSLWSINLSLFFLYFHARRRLSSTNYLMMSLLSCLHWWLLAAPNNPSCLMSVRLRSSALNIPPTFSQASNTICYNRLWFLFLVCFLYFSDPADCCWITVFILRNKSVWICYLFFFYLCPVLAMELDKMLVSHRFWPKSNSLPSLFSLPSSLLSFNVDQSFWW